MLSRPRLRVKEVLLLTLPMMLFIGAGVYFARFVGGPYHVVVEEGPKVVPVNPREVFEGFDTKVVLQARTVGKLEAPDETPYASTEITVKNVRLVCKINGKEKVVRDESRLPDLHIRYMIGQGTSTLLLFKLAPLPAAWGETTLKFDVLGWRRYLDTNVPDAKTASVPLSLVVRKQGQKITTPVVTKYRPFTLHDVGVNDNPRLKTKGNTIVTVRVKYQAEQEEEIRGAAPWAMATYIQDEHGKKYSKFKLAGFPQPEELYPNWQGPYTSTDVNDCMFVKYTDSCAFEIPLWQIPKSAGKLTFHTFVSMGDCWPLPVSVVIRDEKGKTPYMKPYF